MENYRIECYHDSGRFLSELKDFDVSRNPYLSYAYLIVYFKYFHNNKYYFFNVYENENLIAIIPFECTFESKLFHLKYFRFIGYRQFNYEQYICDDNNMAKVHNAFMCFLKKQSYDVVLNIYDINNKSPLYESLKVDSTQKTSLKLYSCPCLHFSENFDDFFKSVFTSSKKRSELKKFQRKVCELGEFRIVNVNNKESYNSNLKYIDQIYRIHAERFKGVYATSFFGSEKMRPFYSDLIESLIKGEKGYLSLLILDQIVIAFVLCLSNDDVLIDWIPAFDPAFAKYSLGIVQYKMMFESICEQGKYKIFDYSKGESVYKSKWAKEETYNSQFILNLNKWNPFSLTYYFFEKFKFSLKVQLRRKHVLSWVKNIMGTVISYLNKDNNPKHVKITILQSLQECEYKFDYAKIREYPIEAREAVLTALYQGKKVFKVSENEVVISQ